MAMNIVLHGESTTDTNDNGNPTIERIKSTNGAAHVTQINPATGLPIQLLNGGLRTADVYAPARDIFVNWFFGADDSLATLTAGANSYGNSFQDMSTHNIQHRCIVIVNGNASPNFNYTVDFSRNAVGSSTDDVLPIIASTNSTSQFTRIPLTVTHGYDLYVRLGITPDALDTGTKLNFKAYLVGRGG